MRNPVKRLPRLTSVEPAVPCGMRVCTEPARYYREVGTGVRRTRVLRCETHKRASGRIGWKRLTNYGGVG